MRTFSFTSAACALTLCVSACTDSSRPEESPSPTYSAAADGIIPNRYIITLKPGIASASAEASRLATGAGGRVLHTYQYALRGFAAELSPQALERVKNDPAILAIEADRRVTVHGVQNPAGSWALDRVDQRNLPLDGLYRWDNGAPSVRIYIVDTGILSTHLDFKVGTGNRVSFGFSAFNDGNNMTDCNGHGTSMASLAAGKKLGIAKQAKLVSVRVLDCQGSGATSGVIAGIDWITANAIKPAVANVSLGGPLNAALTQAVTNSINSGVVYGISAGASATDACQFSPGNAPGALTVASSDMQDRRASFTNIGTCLDLFAPGVSIRTAWRTSNNATLTLSGTSLSAAIVSGAAAIYLQAHPTATPPTVNGAIIALATQGVLTNVGAGSPNLLLYTVGLGQ